MFIKPLARDAERIKRPLAALELFLTTPTPDAARRTPHADKQPECSTRT